MHDYLRGMDEPRPPDVSPLRSFGFRLWHVKHAFMRHLEAALTPLGLTHMQYVVLRAVDCMAQAGEQPTQARLAEWTVTDRMMVSKVLRLLEGKGLVARPVHPDDARAHHVVLTEAGRRMVARAIPVAMRVQAEFFGRLGAERMELLSTILDEVLRLEGSPIARSPAAAWKADAPVGDKPLNVGLALPAGLVGAGPGPGVTNAMSKGHA